MLNGPGKILQQARKKKRYTTDKVHTTTKIKKEYIEGLENDNVSVFPAEIYYKNFLKSYASYLGLNPNEIISIYEQAKIEQQEDLFKQANNNIENKFSEIYNNNKTIFISFGCLIIIFLLVIIINTFFIKNRELLHKDTTNGIIISTATVSTTTANQQIAKQETQTKQKLYIKALSDTWVKIVSDNKTIFEGTLTKSFESKANEEFKVKIGNVDTVQVYFNGQLIDIKKDSPKSKVKNITLTKNQN